MKKILSFSLFGNNEIYSSGAIENAKRHKKFFSDWEMRVYHNESVDSKVIDTLNLLGCITIDTFEDTNYFATMWRFYPMSEEGVLYTISRDCDSRIFERDEESVNEWIESGKKFHIIRDHPEGHWWPINAGMWGYKNDGSLNLIDLINYYKKNNYRPHENTIDQHFLKDMVYQTAIKDCYLNDEYFNYEGFGEKIKRDRKMDDFAFIGEPFDKNNNQLTNYRDSIKNRYYNY